MRNLKKLFAVIVAVAMLASLMVPALAADYDADAQKLYDLGLFKGISTTSYQPDLDATLTRETGLALMIRAAGLEAEVQAMTAEEVTEQLAKIVDADEIAEWAKPYAAYAVKNGLTNGVDASILPNIKFGAKLDLSGKEFIAFMLKAMGYTAVAWDDVLTKAAEVGMLSAGESVTFGTTAVLTRDGAVGVMSGAMGGTTSAGITLAQSLVDAGVVTADDMATAGYFAPTATPIPEPEELTATAYTDNLIQIYVVYSQEVDEDSAEDTDNYEIEDETISDIALQDDGITAVLTLDAAKDQQDTVDLTISGVKDLAGTEMDEYLIEDIEFLDTTIPTALVASVVGNDTFKVVFSEPMQGDANSELDRDDFVVKSSKTLYVKKVTLQSNNTEALVEMYAKLDEGEVELQVKSGSEDYAGFGVVGKTFALKVVPDEETPEVIGYEDADQYGVTLIWSEDIERADDATVDDFYHTNGNNEVEALPDIDGNKMTLSFSEDEKLPEGTAYVYVLKEAVNDLWDNENTQQMIQIEVEIDETAPEVDETDVGYDEVEGLYYLELTFTEDLDGESAIDEDNYTVLDSDGDEIENAIDWIEPTNEDDVEDTIKIYFTDEDMSGDYSIVIENVEDKSDNEIESVTIPFTIGDEIAPDDDDFEAVLYNASVEDQMLKVSFDDVMATDGKYSVTDVDKYVVVADDATETSLEDIDDVEIAVSDDGKSVEITIPSKADSDDGFDLDDTFDLVIARVADAAGNKLDSLYTRAIPIDESSEVTIEEAKATAVDTIEVTFSDELVKFDVDDILFNYTVGAEVYSLEIGSVDVGLDDGQTVAIYTLGEDDELDYNASKDGTLAITATVVESDDVDSENEYGDELLAEDTYVVEDGIAPEVAENNDDEPDIVFANGTTDSTITITFTEDLEDDVATEGLFAHDLIVKDDEGDALTAGTDFTTEVNGDELEVTVVGVTDLDNYSIQSEDSITYIKDDEGNEAKTFGRVKN